MENLLQEKLEEAFAIYEEAKLHAMEGGRSLRATLLLFSGGNDSTVLADIFHPVVDYAAHANTGIGVEQTRQFVRDTCKAWGLPLLEKHPKPGRTYRDLVLGDAISSRGPNKGKRAVWSGFPGPPGHGVMFNWLKDRALREIRSELVKNPRKERIIFLSGIRRSESQRRSQRPKIDRQGSVVWCNPLINWTGDDMRLYRSLHPDMPHNEVTDFLHMSGECLCGAYAHPGELEELEMWYPEVAAEIKALEKEAEARGIPQCKWGRGDGRHCRSGCNT